MKLNFQEIATKTAALGAGAVGANVVTGMIPDTVDARVKPVIGITVGAFLPTLLSGKGKSKKASPFIQSLGDGMIAASAQQLISQVLPEDMKAKLKISGVSYYNDPYVAEYVPEYINKEHVADPQEKYDDKVMGADTM